MKVSLLFSKATQWAGGLGNHQVGLGLTHFSQSSINSDLGNGRQTELNFQISRSVTLSASNNATAARSLAVVYVEKARTNLKNYLGERWSPAWIQAGFKTNSLVIPATNTAEVLHIVRSLQTYLTNNPTHANATAGVAAMAAGAQVTALEGAVTTLNNAKSAQRTKREARDTSHQTLTGNLRGSRKELEAVLPKGDPRWLDFCPRVPADLRAPEAVSALVAESGMPGHVRLSFLPSLRADWYGVEVATSPDGPFTNLVTLHDTVGDLVLTPGATVRIRVRARNAAGESGPSPVVEVTVPVAAAA